MNKAETAKEIVERKDYLVPFIGDDLFYVSSDNGSKQPLQSYIVDCFIKSNPDIKILPEEIEAMKTTGYHGLSLLNRKFRTRYIEHYKKYVKEAMPDIHLNEDVKTFLELGNFPLIITTSSFGFIEKELANNEAYTSLYYSIEHPPVNEIINPRRHTVFHLFGEGERHKSKWLYNERMLLMFLHSLHDSTTAPKGVTSYLADKSLIMLGCNLPNWLFQFLWYPMNIQRNPLFPNEEDATEGYFLGKSQEQADLDDFLQEIGFTSVEEMEEVIRETNKLLKKNQTPKTDKFDIFISYASENAKLARKIKDHLVSKGLAVWIDKDGGEGEIEKGGAYWKRIEEGIHNSRFFMPIVTSEYLNKWLATKLLATNEAGLVKETNMALDWINSDNNPYKEEEIYSLPVIIEESSNQEFVNKLVDQNILPKELFDGIQCYTYSEHNDCTFTSHRWEKYKR